MNKYLFAALDSVTVGDILDSKNFGNLIVEVKNENINADNFKIPIGCCQLSRQKNYRVNLKVTSSYKLMKALGIYKVDVPTGELYKSGMKKGLSKTRKEFRNDGVKDVLEWAIQLNYYRLLLENQGFKVNRMFIQALCRDSNLRIAQERGIDKTVYIIPINSLKGVAEYEEAA